MASIKTSQNTESENENESTSEANDETVISTTTYITLAGGHATASETEKDIDFDFSNPNFPSISSLDANNLDSQMQPSACSTNVTSTTTMTTSTKSSLGELRDLADNIGSSASIDIFENIDEQISSSSETERNSLKMITSKYAHSIDYLSSIEKCDESAMSRQLSIISEKSENGQETETKQGAEKSHKERKFDVLESSTDEKEEEEAVEEEVVEEEAAEEEAVEEEKEVEKFMEMQIEKEVDEQVDEQTIKENIEDDAEKQSEKSIIEKPIEMEESKTFKEIECQTQFDNIQPPRTPRTTPTLNDVADNLIHVYPLNNLENYGTTSSARSTPAHHTHVAQFTEDLPCCAVSTYVVEEKSSVDSIPALISVGPFDPIPRVPLDYRSSHHSIQMPGGHHIQSGGAPLIDQRSYCRRVCVFIAEVLSGIGACLQLNKDCIFCLAFFIAFVVSVSFLTAFFYRTLTIDPQMLQPNLKSFNHPNYL